MGDRNNDIPDAPDPSEDYRQGFEFNLANLPRVLGAENQFREQYDPTRIAQQQGLQELFGPTQYRQQLQALEQLDPQWFQTHQALGQQIGRDLEQGHHIPEDMRREAIGSLRGAQAARG